MRHKNQCILSEHHGSTQLTGLITQPNLMAFHPKMHCSPSQHSDHTDHPLCTKTTQTLNFCPCYSFTSSTRQNPI